jgi:hypothetical protein
MKRTMVVMFLLALLLAWGGTAMAEPDVMEDNVGELCGEEYDVGEGGTYLGMWPYFPAQSSNWWNGVVIGNTSDTDTIAEDTLCFVGVDADGESYGAEYGQRIYPQHVKAFLKETIDTDEEGWENSLYLGVYASNAADDVEDVFFGFGMLGSKNDAGVVGGNFVDRLVQEAEELAFNYMPGNKWASAIVVINATEDDVDDAVVTVVQDGNVETFDELEIGAGEMAVLTPTILNALAEDTVWDESKTAYITVASDDAALYGWAQFGNGKGTVGYLPEN